MQLRLADIRAAGGEVLAVSVDAPEESREVVQAYALEFPLLSDPRAEVIEAYGVLHADSGLGKPIARPATFLIDREGRIVWRDLTENWRVRVRASELVRRLEALP